MSDNITLKKKIKKLKKMIVELKAKNSRLEAQIYNSMCVLEEQTRRLYSKCYNCGKILDEFNGESYNGYDLNECEDCDYYGISYCEDCSKDVGSKCKIHV